MQQFLQDVDANPNLLKQDGQLRILSSEMRELAFRAEDAISTYLFEVESKISNNNFLLKIWPLASHFHFYSLHMLRKQIECIQQEIETAMRYTMRTSISATGQSQRACVGSSYSKPFVESYIHLDAEYVVGIEDDITRLVKRLTDPQDDFQVLGIVGTGGAGKTTIASQIYRHSKVQSLFSHRIFVSISQQWSRLDLLHRISKEILGESNLSLSERELIKEFRDFMKDKQYLVVLDDIWKKEAWDDIYPIFARTQGVKVILTTRIEEVPLYADKKCILHQPQPLTMDQMWTLFSKGAVEGRHGIENNLEFEKLGKLMVQKCNGLPLAVVTLAGILRTKRHLYEWERVSEDLATNILKEKGGFTYGVVEEMIELSYLDLPTHLKTLVLYLAIIPKDKVWPSKQLIQMWIAEGFVTDDQRGRCETLEDKGIQFMSELAQRCIIRVNKRNHRDEVELFSLDGLMREFCIKKARDYQFFLREENNYFRTILISGLSDQLSDGVIKKLESIHEDFKMLRVLRITSCANKTLPKQIGNLILLTYLSIVDTQITELPESVKKLCNLIYLEFHPLLAEGRAAKVPDHLVGNMEHLRVLDLQTLKGGSINCKRLGLSSERHKKLHTFRCGVGRWMMKDLPEMHLLTLGDFQITNIEEIEEMELIYQCMGFFKGSLQKFECTFYERVSKELKFDTEKLMGSQSLHTLNLVGRLLNNCTIQAPSNLESLTLIQSEIGEEVDLMGVLGQLSKLKYLFLGSNAFLGTQLSCSGGSFPQLKELTFRLNSLREWKMEGDSMDRLNKIHIFGCRKLKRLPREIKYITTIKELQIAFMPDEFCRRLGYKRDENGGLVQTQEGENYYIIQHIPSIKFSLM